MIYLTFYYLRDIFTGNEFQKWITDLFGNDVKFYGSEGKRFGVIGIRPWAFEKNKDKIPTKNLVSIEGKFGLLQQLSLGVRNFKNTL